MKIVLWCGSKPNQKALANKLHSYFSLAGMVIEKRKPVRKITLKKIFEKDIEKIFIPLLDRVWKNLMLTYTHDFPDFPSTEKLKVENINSDEAFRFTQHLHPDFILVSGTRLVKEKMLSLNPRIGILNLHTGLSPYIKGGPNCTNWCLATGRFHLIGNTVMWMDKGIDSGNLLTSEFTPLTGNESLLQLHLRVMNYAHELYVRAVQFIKGGGYRSIPQKEIAEGKTFYTRNRTLKQKWNAVKNFRSFKSFLLQENQRKKYEKALLPKSNYPEPC